MTVRVRRDVEVLPPYRALASRRPAIGLDGNENPLGPSPAALAALAALPARDVARYPAAQRVATRWARALGVRRDQVLLSPGSGPAVALAAELVLGPGDTGVLLAPSFELYGLAVRRRGATVRAVPCRPGGRFPVRRLERALPGAALCVLGLPDNPTGVAPSLAQLRRLSGAFPDTLFVVDEAYAEFAGVSAVPLLAHRPNLVVLRTLSKAHGLAGLRVGALIGSRGLVARARRLGPPHPLAAPSAAAALASLDDRRHVRRTVRLVRRERPLLARGLRAAGLPTVTSTANFVLADAGSAPRAAALERALAALGIGVRDRSRLPGLAGRVRVSVGTAEERARLLDAIRLLRAPPPEALLLDMDGTLIDVSRSYDEIIWQLVRRHAGGRLRSRARVLAIKRDPRANDDVDAIMLALARRGVRGDRRVIARAFTDLYRGPGGLHRRDRWLVTPAALHALAAWRPLAVVTGRPREDLALAFRNPAYRRAFAVAVTAGDTRRGKPDPQPVRRALRLLGVRRAWMIGDSPADLLAARAAGVAAIGIGTGARAAMLRTHRPLAVLPSVAMLADVRRARALFARGVGDA